MASTFFGRIASALSRWGKKGEHGPMTKRSSADITKTETSSQATTGQSPERPVGSVKPSGGSASYSPGTWRDKPMSTGLSDAAMNSASKGTGKNGRAESPRRNAYESSDSPKGLWGESKHERLSDPFSERPSREPASRPSAHSIH